MKKLLLLCALFVLPAVNVFAGIDENIADFVKDLNKAQDQELFDRMYYMLHMGKAEESLGRGVSRETYIKWLKALKEADNKLIAVDKDFNDLLVKQFAILQIPGGNFVKASQTLYDKLFDALKKEGKVTIQYGPDEGSVVTSTEIVVE